MRIRDTVNKGHRALLAAVGVVSCLLGVPLSLWARSATFGFSLGLFARETAVIAFFLLFIMAPLAFVWWAIERGRLPLRRVLAAMLVWVAAAAVVAPLIAEAFCGIEEQLFVREARANGGTHYFRNRWFPFENHGLGWDNGTYWAQD